MTLERNEVDHMKPNIKRVITLFAIVLAVWGVLNLGSSPVFAELPPLYITVAGKNAPADAKPECTVTFRKGNDDPNGPDEISFVIGADSYTDGVFLSRNLMPEILEKLDLEHTTYPGNRMAYNVRMDKSDADITSGASYTVEFQMTADGKNLDKINFIFKLMDDNNQNTLDMNVNSSGNIQTNTFRYTNTYKEKTPPTPPTPEPKTQYRITVDPNGGVWPDGSSEPQIHLFDAGDIFTLPAAPSAENRVFDYWKGSRYNPGDKYVVTEDHDFVATWVPKDQDITIRVPWVPTESNTQVVPLPTPAQAPSTPTSVSAIELPKTGESTDSYRLGSLMLGLSSVLILLASWMKKR